MIDRKSQERDIPTSTESKSRRFRAVIQNMNLAFAEMVQLEGE